MLESNNTGLIVVDVQGKLAQMVDGSEQMIANIVKLIEGAKALDLPIIWLEQIPENLGQTAEPIAHALTGFVPFHKHTFSGCRTESVAEAIRACQVEQWLLCGIETHICVYQTAMDLKRMGFEPQVVSDCVSSRDAANKELALKKLCASGVDLTGLEMCLFELMENAKHPAFKALLPLFK
ncbi:isochorismatase family protein [Vibrio navarrensis]